MKILYEDLDHRVIEKPEAEHGIHILVKDGGFWCAGMWDGKALVKSLINELKKKEKSHDYVSAMSEKIRRPG